MVTTASPSSESASPVHPIPDALLNPNSAISSITIQNIGSMVPIKLTTTNYLTWSALFAPIFRRYNLTGLIDGSLVAPPKYLECLDSSGNRIATLNPTYVTWFENDQNILIWINSTLSESLIPYTVGVTSARELWAKLESRLATASQSHIHELRSRLRSLVKGDLTAAQYLQQIEEIANAFASAGAPVEDSELISEIQLNNRKKPVSTAPFQAYHSSVGLLPLPENFPPQGFVASHASQGFTNHASHSAMIANTSSSTPTWIVDSGASSHMTNSTAHLQNTEAYTGPEQVYIGDGKEFVSTAFSQFLSSSGIHHQLTCPHTPEQNGCAERKHMHIVETARTLLATSKAPRAWYAKLHTALTSLGFHGSQSDHSLFIKQSPTLVFILVYVDDILVTGPSSAACQQVISHLRALFPIKDLGALHYFLGIEVKRSSSGIFINQTNFAVNLVCQFMHTPRLSHMQAVKRILCYLKGSLDLGLWFSKCSQAPSLHAFSDADWLWCDNISALSLAKNPIFHARTKHVELDYHYIRDSIFFFLNQNGKRVINKTS
ncbi:hypothetical protein D8674_027355 [Pyrus ussuriensis x Pyrus communis]|uniref:Integrase catalytic domain-containing protein n=1 Tax=Pyrus ussuriensis x Pyrus communis TaxID=2448454 RepID=A0A5N5IE15_9ROSA|nr:hypothetical protein D8674_027355 [Pyrus ussuriensis x Pyrus communis]